MDLPHARARGKPSYTVSILLATDIITDSKAVSVIQGIKLLALRYRMPQRLIVDAGSQLTRLNTKNKEVLEATTVFRLHHSQLDTSFPTP